jgi:flagellar biosynthesis protein FlhF
MLLLQRRLQAQGVEGAIAAALVRATAERLLTGAPLGTALAGTLEPAVAAPAPARVRLFVGPPGDGKTTTVVKLAAQARREGRRVALVSTDTYRLGTAAELATYARVLDVAVAQVADADELGATLKGLEVADVVLVDTAGVAPGQATELGELADLTRAAGPEAGRTLVASATAGPWAVRQIWEAFGPLAPDSCVMTKLDLAPGGPLLGRCWRAGVPVTHVADGRSIPDDLAPATPERLARCLLAA